MKTPAALIEKGFERITQWVPRGAGMRVFSLEWEESSGWLYAFVVDGVVKYIGLTCGVLRTRLDQYRDGRDSYGYESQCGRVRAAILGELLAGRAVEIYGLRKPQWTREALRADERTLIDEYRQTGIWNRA